MPIRVSLCLHSCVPGYAYVQTHALMVKCVCVCVCVCLLLMTCRLMFITLDIFYNDLAFRHKLKLFRASTNSGYYLNYRRKWLHVLPRHTPKPLTIQVRP